MTGKSEKRYVTNNEICARHGGSREAFAPMRDGKVLLLRETLEKNPDAPEVILFSREKPKVWKAGLALVDQGGPVPAYLKEGDRPKGCAPWLDLGEYEVVGWSQDAADIEHWQARAGRTDVGLVVFMRPAGAMERAA